jgi:hypothetical protein
VALLRTMAFFARGEDKFFLIFVVLLRFVPPIIPGKAKFATPGPRPGQDVVGARFCLVLSRRSGLLAETRCAYTRLKL